VTSAESRINPPRDPRRHDLDALRAFAMLLGIGLHAALSFTGHPWIVQDEGRSESLGMLVSAIHGFRMPVFFLLSGFFTAMLCRRRGLTGLLTHRAKRIALPLAIGCVTIVPLTWMVINFAMATNAENAGPASAEIDTSRDVWTAAAYGDTEAVLEHFERGANIEATDPIYQTTPLGWAVIGDHPGLVDRLLDEGADPNTRYGDSNTALHSAAFFGRADAAALLLNAGADPGAVNDHGETPADSMRHDRGTTEFIASLLSVPIDFEEISAGRERIGQRLAKQGGDAASNAANTESSPVRDALQGLLVELPFFHHLWFLWHLCWLIAGYALVTLALDLLPAVRLPTPLIASPLALLWLVPLTMGPQMLMHGVGTVPGFGPDTSAGLLPMAHVLAYYGIFFGFGAMLHSVPGGAERIGRGWWLTLPLAAALFFPVMYVRFEAGAAGRLGLGPSSVHALASAGEVLYVWLMILGLMGFFRVMLARERSGVRYVSDASYWLYLAHMPLIILGQLALSHVDLPAGVKVLALATVTTALLLLVYELGVRYTIIGTILNGKRTRHRAIEPPCLTPPTGRQ